MTDQEKEWLCGVINAVQLLAKREGIELELYQAVGLDVRGIKAVDQQLCVLEGPMPNVANAGTVIYRIGNSTPFYELNLIWMSGQFVYSIDLVYSRKERLGTPVRPTPRNRNTKTYEIRHSKALTVAETIIVCHFGLLLNRAGTSVNCDGCPLQLTCLGEAQS